MTAPDLRVARRARELVEARLTLAVLEAMTLALQIEHPTLDDFPEPNEPPSLRDARSVVHRAGGLRLAIRRYIRAVRDALGEQPDHWPL